MLKYFLCHYAIYDCFRHYFTYMHMRNLCGYEGYPYPTFWTGGTEPPLFEQCQSIFYSCAFPEIEVSALLRVCKKLVSPLFVYVGNWYPTFWTKIGTPLVRPNLLPCVYVFYVCKLLPMPEPVGQGPGQKNICRAAK